MPAAFTSGFLTFCTPSGRIHCLRNIPGRTVPPPSCYGLTMQQHDGSASKSRGAALLCMGGMVIISAAQLAMAVYLLLKGRRETLLIVTESFMIYSVSVKIFEVRRRISPLIRTNPQVNHQSCLSGLAFTLLPTMSKICKGKPTDGQQDQKHIINSPGADHCDVDDCLGAVPHHCHQGFYQ